MTAKTAAPPLTVEDLLDANHDDRYLGFGYPYERQAARERVRRAMDEQVVRAANEAGWTADNLFHWANSKIGRWFADVAMEGTPAAHAAAAQYLTLKGLEDVTILGRDDDPAEAG